MNTHGSGCSDRAALLPYDRAKENMMTLRICLLAGLLGLTVGCGSSYSSGPNAPTPTPTPTPITTGNGTPVSIVLGAAGLTRTAYAPNPINVGAGATVTWTNDDTIAHTSTGDDGSWNSGTLAPGSSFSRNFPSAGTFSYHCAIHPGMIGTVVVQ
jgi:plastocyanin